MLFAVIVKVLCKKYIFYIAVFHCVGKSLLQRIGAISAILVQREEAYLHFFRFFGIAGYYSFYCAFTRVLRLQALPHEFNYEV